MGLLFFIVYSHSAADLNSGLEESEFVSSKDNIKTVPFAKNSSEDWTEPLSESGKPSSLAASVNVSLTREKHAIKIYDKVNHKLLFVFSMPQDEVYQEEYISNDRFRATFPVSTSSNLILKEFILEIIPGHCLYDARDGRVISLAGLSFIKSSFCERYDQDIQCDRYTLFQNGCCYSFEMKLTSISSSFFNPALIPHDRVMEMNTIEQIIKSIALGFE